MKYAFQGCEEFHSDLVYMCVNIEALFTIWVIQWGDSLASQVMVLLCKQESGEITLFPQMFLPVNSKSYFELTLLIVWVDFLQAFLCLTVHYWS